MSLTIQQRIQTGTDITVVGPSCIRFCLNPLLCFVAVKELAPKHEAQLPNYLRATPYEVGILLNFGPKPAHKRKAFNNERKPSPTWRK